LQNHFQLLRNARGARACLPGPASLKPAHRAKGTAMGIEAIIAILVFIAALGGLNYYEYGRLD
jgi:hypothetical protein